MKLNMAVIDQREAEAEAQRLKEANDFITANRQAIVDQTIKTILATLQIPQEQPKIDWGTIAYNAQSVEEKRRQLQLEGLKNIGAFL